MLKGVNERTHGSSCYLKKTVSSLSGFTQMRITFLLFVWSPSRPPLYVFLHWFSATKCQVLRSPTRSLPLSGSHSLWENETSPESCADWTEEISTPSKGLRLAWTPKYQARTTFYHFRIFQSFFKNCLLIYLREREREHEQGEGQREGEEQAPQGAPHGAWSQDQATQEPLSKF